MALTIVKCGGAALAKEPFVLDRYVESGRASASFTVRAHGSRLRCGRPGSSRRLSGAGVSRPQRRCRSSAKRSAGRTRALCSEIGPRACGLMGDDLGLEAERLPELGHAGMLLPVVPPALRPLLETDAVPVIAPLARGPLNVNADDAAAVLAVALAQTGSSSSPTSRAFSSTARSSAVVRTRHLQAERSSDGRHRPEAPGGRARRPRRRPRGRRPDVDRSLDVASLVEALSLYFLKLCW